MCDCYLLSSLLQYQENCAMLPLTGVMKKVFSNVMLRVYYHNDFLLLPSSWLLSSLSPPSSLSSSLPIVLSLVRKGADVTNADNKGRTALHFAACRGDANLGTSNSSLQSSLLVPFHLHFFPYIKLMYINPWDACMEYI